MRTEMGSNVKTNGEDTEHKDTIKVLGREFTIVNRGLDREQVSGYIKELEAERENLLSERDANKKREEYVNSLKRLAEKMVVEAEALAAEIKAEIQKKAEAEASQIMVRAKEVLLKVYNELLAELADVQQRVNVSSKEFEPSLASPVRGTSPKQDNGIAGEAKESEIQTQGSEQSANEGKMIAYRRDREIQLDIIPPYNINKVSKIIHQLFNLPQVEDAELVISSDKPSIVVLQNETVKLVEFSKLLAGFPQVKEVKVADSETTGSGRNDNAAKRRNRIEVLLA